MSNYVDEIESAKEFKGNVVILIDGQYYAIRAPDSGLSISPPFDECIQSLVLNPTTVDLRRVTTTISSFSFRLIDRELAISALVQGSAANFVGKEATVWLGRSGVDMDFSEYFQLPITRIKKCSHPDNSYNFSTSEDTDRMRKAIYTQTSMLAAGVLAATTTFVMDRDLSDYPTAGLLKLDDEFMSYAGVDLILRRFTGVIRGELNTTPADHDLGTQAYLCEEVSGNPLDILLQILISGGGGGPYDVLQSGLGISQSLIDLNEIENIRDSLFDDFIFNGVIYNVTTTLQVIEKEILTPLNLRFSYSQNSKLTLATIDRAVFVEDNGSITEDSITKFPTWDVDGNTLTNVIKVDWDYDEAQKKYLRSVTFKDDISIAAYGEQSPLTFQFKWFHDDDGAEEKVNEMVESLFVRLAYPVPTVGLNVQMDKSLRTIGDKAFIYSSQIPAADGTLNFASEMEIVSRSINVLNGDVQFKLAFTSFTSIRSGYISPSDLIDTVLSQSKVTLPAGRGTYYKVGWKMRLWDEVNDVYLADPVNTILKIEGDDVTFENAWSTVLSTDYRIRFADYDDAVTTQKRYAFVSDGSNNFPDGGAPYSVTY